MATSPELTAADRPATRSPAIAIRNRLLKGSAWVSLGMVLSMVLGVVMNALIARLLTHEEVGAYLLIFSIATIGSQLANFGMEKAVVRVVSASIGTKNPGGARRAVAIAVAVSTIGALVLAGALVVGLANFLANHVARSPVVGHLVGGAVALTAGILIGTTLNTLLAEIFRGFQRFWLATVFRDLAIDAMAVAVFGILYLTSGSATLTQILVASLAFLLVNIVVGVAILSRDVTRLERTENDVRVGGMLSIGWPLVLTNLVGFGVGTTIDLWIIGAYLPGSDVALYGYAFKLVFFVATPFIIASQVVPPIIAEQYARGKKGPLERSLRDVATIAFVPAAGVLLAFVAFGGPIMGFLYGDFYSRGATVLSILSLARLYAVATGNSGSLLMMTGHQRTMLAITATSAVFSITAELILVRAYGLIGVAIGTAAAQTLQNTLQLVLGKRKVGIWTHVEASVRPVRELLTAAPRRGRKG